MAKPKILENISTIQNSGFTNRAKQAEVTSYKELGNGRWFGDLTDAPESGVFFYNVFKGDNDNYKYVEAMSWINNKVFISKCINGEWSSWKESFDNKLDAMIEKFGQSLNQKLDVGQYHFQNATDGFPQGYTTDNDFVLTVYSSGKGNLDWCRKLLFDIRSNRIFTQRRTEGTLKGWVELADIDKINVLSGGDVKNANEISVTDANNLPIGWYTGDLTNAPYKDWATFHTFNKLGNSYKTQVAYGVNNPFMAYRNFINGKYEDWKQIATTDKTEILLAPRTNITITDNKCYKTSLFTVVDVTFKKTDGSDFSANTYKDVAGGFDSIYTKYIPIIGCCFDAGGEYIGDAYGYRWNDALYIYPRVNCKSISVYSIECEVI